MNAEMQNEMFLGENVGNYESYPKPLTTDEYYLEKMYRLVKATPTISNYSAAVPSSGGFGGTDGLMSAADKEKLDGMQTGAQANVQADWAQDDSTADDYILHKPDLSQLPKFSIKVVSDLPVSDISYTTIYLVPITNSTSPDMYTEYIRVKGENGASDAWEALGTQTVDLSDYVTTDALNNALANKANSTHTHTSLAYSYTLGTNLDNYESTGMWLIGNLSGYTNKPTTLPENGVLIVFAAAGVIQLLLGGYQRVIYYRCKREGYWQPWVKLNSTASS